MDPFGFRPPNHSWNHNYYQQPFFQQPQKRGIGILNKILGKGQGPGHLGGYPQQMFGYGPGMASKYHSLHETLNHIQKGLGIVQQVSPYIKQYGPFVKNLPMIIDMMKIMMENEDEANYDDEGIKDDNIKDMAQELMKDDHYNSQDNHEHHKPKHVKKHYKKHHENSKQDHLPKEMPKPKMYI
ncbi:hypothetical protein E3U55_04190 [Filobacillus milosensis]|uniref:YqfQ-like protein n=1 Tax=Filobacillus milosensis TaxID=94137 RepID=A0A4Y8IV05_9BACI|nr:VrrA/YqfQ family protein [Filobacillus milosensis]TFB24019.1 hypothetical protein E3U55_04190 [Filobacillus milosensis]